MCSSPYGARACAGPLDEAEEKSPATATSLSSLQGSGKPAQVDGQRYLPYISPISPLHLPYISPILPSRRSPRARPRRARAASAGYHPCPRGRRA